MNGVKLRIVMVVVVGAVSMSVPARAETLLTPWLGANTRGRDAPAAIDFGVTAGTTVAGVIGVDVDFGYSPDFFGNNLNSYLLTTMGNVTVGIPFDGTRRAGIRPYVTGGIGLIRARIDSPLYGYSLANNDFVVKSYDVKNNPQPVMMDFYVKYGGAAPASGRPSAVIGPTSAGRKSPAPRETAS